MCKELLEMLDDEQLGQSGQYLADDIASAVESAWE
jgi:hypothetical protein